MKESENENEEPLINKDAKQEKIEVLENQKGNNGDKPIEQLEVGKTEEESEEGESNFQKMTLKKENLKMKEWNAQQMKDINMTLIWNQILLTDFSFIGLSQF